MSAVTGTHQRGHRRASFLPSGGVLFACGHCSRTLDFGGEFLIEYAEVLVNG